MSAAFDYERQAWTVDGRYVRCGHPASMDCQCYGKLHAGEAAVPVRCTGYADTYSGSEQCELERGHEGRCEVRDSIDDETGQVLR